MKGKITAVLFIIVFLLVVAVVCTFLTSWDRSDDVPPSSSVPENPEESSVITIIDPQASANIQTPTETPTPTLPVETPEPTPTATPTPIETPEPVFTVTALGSGSFASESGAKLDIRADWSAKAISSSQVEITVTISLDSYSIHLSAVPNSVNLNLGGQYVSLDAPAIDYDGADLINTVLASKTFTVDLAEGQSDSFSLGVEWHFGGTYGGMEIPVIECGGSIALAR